MNFLSALLWIIGAVIMIGWAYGVRSFVRAGQGVSQQTVNQTMMFALSLVAVPLLGLSAFHLLWLFPTAFILGFLSLGFPFSLISIPGRVFGTICCIGLGNNQSAGAINLVDKDGNYKPHDYMTPEEEKNAFDAEVKKLTEKSKKTDFD